MPQSVVSADINVTAIAIAYSMVFQFLSCACLFVCLFLILTTVLSKTHLIHKMQVQCWLLNLFLIPRVIVTSCYYVYHTSGGYCGTGDKVTSLWHSLKKNYHTAKTATTANTLFCVHSSYAFVCWLYDTHSLSKSLVLLVWHQNSLCFSVLFLA